METFDRYISEGKSGDTIFGLLKSSRAKEPIDHDYSKSELREALLNEQGFICCYCNQTIANNEKTFIEHLQDKGTFRQLTFEYTNLLASCNGSQKMPKPRHQHCDTEKGSQNLLLSPLDEFCEIQLYFSSKGVVYARCEDGENAIRVLNLNAPQLVRQRMEAIESQIYDAETLELIDDNVANIILNDLNNKDTQQHFAEFCTAIKSAIRREVLNQTEKI